MEQVQQSRIGRGNRVDKIFLETLALASGWNLTLIAAPEPLLPHYLPRDRLHGPGVDLSDASGHLLRPCRFNICFWGGIERLDEQASQSRSVGLGHLRSFVKEFLQTSDFQIMVRDSTTEGAGRRVPGPTVRCSVGDPACSGRNIDVINFARWFGNH